MPCRCAARNTSPTVATDSALSLSTLPLHDAHTRHVVHTRWLTTLSHLSTRTSNVGQGGAQQIPGEPDTPRPLCRRCGQSLAERTPRVNQGRLGLVDLDVRRVIGEAALVAAVLEADETLLAPVDVPRVAHLGRAVGGSGVRGWSKDGSGLRATMRASRGNGGGRGAASRSPSSTGSTHRC